MAWPRHPRGSWLQSRKPSAMHKCKNDCHVTGKTACLTFFGRHLLLGLGQHNPIPPTEGLRALVPQRTIPRRKGHESFPCQLLKTFMSRALTSPYGWDFLGLLNPGLSEYSLRKGGVRTLVELYTQLPSREFTSQPKPSACYQSSQAFLPQS